MKSWYIVQSHSSFENKVAQLVERRSPKPEVGGSIPSAPAINLGNVYEEPT